MNGNTNAQEVGRFSLIIHDNFEDFFMTQTREVILIYVLNSYSMKKVKETN